MLLTIVVLLALFIPAGPLTLDSHWSELMQDIQTPILTHLALVFNAIGTGFWRGLTLTAVGLVLLLARRPAALLSFAIAETLTPLLDNLIKTLVTRPRPPDAMLNPHGTSFPSGHAAAAFAAASVLERHLGYRASWPALVGATYVATSRLVDNRHFLSDVLMGAGVGTAAGWTVVGTRGRSNYAMQPVPVRGGMMIAFTRVKDEN